MAFTLRQLILATTLCLLLLGTAVSSQKRVTTGPGRVKTTTTTPRPKTIVEKLSDVEKRIASVSATTSDFQLQIQSMFGWEKLLTPAPLSIAVLGDLIVVSAYTLDFRLDETPPEGGFKFMKYPGSFRASLTQISNGGYVAFNTAHNNMDKIRLLMADVPVQIKDATRYILSKNTKVIRKLLPIPLNNMRQVSRECVHLSSRIVRSFEHVMNLTAEVLEACIGTKGVKEQQLADARKDLEVVNKQFELVERQMNQTQKDKEQVEMYVSEWDKKLKEEMDDLPSGWEIMGMNFVEGFSNIVTLQLGKMFGAETAVRLHMARTASAAKQKEEVFQPCLMTRKHELIQLVSLADQFARMSSKSFAKLSRASTGTYKPEKHLQKLDQILGETSDCPQLSDACLLMQEFVNELGEVVGNITNTTDFTLLTNAARDLHKRVNMMHSFVSLQSSVVPPRTPQVSEYLGHSAAETAVKNAKYKVETAKETLLAYQQSSDKIRADLKDTTNHYIDLIRKMRSLKLDEIRYDEAIDLLRQGIQILGKLREHWGKLVQFFQEIDNIIDLILGKSMDSFLQKVEAAKTDVSLIGFSLDSIYASVLRSGQAAHVVKRIAEMYLNVSNKYVMDNVLKLNGLMALDAGSGANIEWERQELQRQCEQDSEAIISYVMEERDRLRESMIRRGIEIAHEYAPILEEARATKLLPDETEDENSLTNYEDDDNLTNESGY